MHEMGKKLDKQNAYPPDVELVRKLEHDDLMRALLRFSREAFDVFPHDPVTLSRDPGVSVNAVWTNILV